MTNRSESVPVRGLQQQRNYPWDSLAVFEEWSDKRLTGGKKIKIRNLRKKKGPDYGDLKVCLETKRFGKGTFTVQRELWQVYGETNFL